MKYSSNHSNYSNTDNNIDTLIINSPFKEPTQFYDYNYALNKYEKKQGRRPAGYYSLDTKKNLPIQNPAMPGEFIPIELVTSIRSKVKQWKDQNYPGVTSITRRLLEHWNNPEIRDYPFFFCQLEAIETLIWLTEGSDSENAPISKYLQALHQNYATFLRLCIKMATGTGKTIVMAMLICWQILNKVTYPDNDSYSKHILIIAPGLTVKKRLEVLFFSQQNNYYDEFQIVPYGFYEKLRQGKIMIHNWHKLSWETADQIAKKKSVDKRGIKSDEAYTREVLSDMQFAKNIIVINDEAHHAWSLPYTSQIQKSDHEGTPILEIHDTSIPTTKSIKKTDIEVATKWLGGLERIHKTRTIHTCYDFSATPFIPMGTKSKKEWIFPWIVSDFGLQDAIESGLVKTPRMVIPNSDPHSLNQINSLYHLYHSPEINKDINRKCNPEEPIPKLLKDAYTQLSQDWKATYINWKASDYQTPPVMITIANRTETAARIKHAFDTKQIGVTELQYASNILHIDTKVLAKAENSLIQKILPNINNPVTNEQAAEMLRQTVDSIGKIGLPGEQICNVISVGMLSEGWDAKTVTHIMGVRAFSSQLLCEQVVGRGLRRASYELNSETGLFDPEYVNIYGIPFQFLPVEIVHDAAPRPPLRKILIQPVQDKQNYEIVLPNIIRIEQISNSHLFIKLSDIPRVTLDITEMPMLKPFFNNDEFTSDNPHLNTQLKTYLCDLYKKNRLQQCIFQEIKKIIETTSFNWKSSNALLFSQLVNIVDLFLKSEQCKIPITWIYEFKPYRDSIYCLNIHRIIHHLLPHIQEKTSYSLEPVFDLERPFISTSTVRPWHTHNALYATKKSHISHCTYREMCSTYENSEKLLGLPPLPFLFDVDELDFYIESWVKNEHLGFAIYYVYRGNVKKYHPEYIIKLCNHKFLMIDHYLNKNMFMDKNEISVRDKQISLWIKAVNHYYGKVMWHREVFNESTQVAKKIVVKKIKEIYSL